MCPDCTRPMDLDGPEYVCRRCGNRHLAEVPEDVASLLEHQREEEAKERSRPYLAKARAAVKAGAEKQIGRRYNRPRQEND